jgi:hypothetical protein
MRCTPLDEILELNQSAFKSIYYGELDDNFESNFAEKFNVTYKEFLHNKFIKENMSSKEIAIILGIVEKELFRHLKYYDLTSTMDSEQWKRFIVSNVSVYSLKAIISIIGLIPIFYVIGYLLLYGLYFGNSETSLIDIVIKFVPINKTACYIAGFIITGIIAFFISIFMLKGLGKIFLIAGAVYFILASTLSLLFIFFNANSNFNWSEISKLLLVWIGPLIGSILIFISIKLGNILSNHLKEVFSAIIISLVVFLFIKKVDIVWLELSYMILSVFLSWFFILIFKRKKSNVEDPKTSHQSKSSKKRSFKEFIYSIVLVISLIIVIIIPLFTSTMFFTGIYFGNVLELVKLLKEDQIKIGDNLYRGQIIATDSDYIYISDSNRKLIKLTSDGNIKITSGKAKVLQGKSENWTIYLEQQSDVGISNYSGYISSKKESLTLNQIKYKIYLKNYSKEEETTINYNKSSKTFYFINYLKDEQLSPETTINSISIEWNDENGKSNLEEINFQSK